MDAAQVDREATVSNRMGMIGHNHEPAADQPVRSHERPPLWRAMQTLCASEVFLSSSRIARALRHWKPFAKMRSEVTWIATEARLESVAPSHAANVNASLPTNPGSG